MPEQFKIGDMVTICDRDPKSVTTVASIGKVKIVMADGSEWRTRSRSAWGSTAWDFRSFRHYNSGDENKIAARENLETVEGFKAFFAMSPVRVAIIADQIRAHRDQMSKELEGTHA